MAVLLLAEKNDLLLINNAKARPPGTIPSPESQFMATNSKDKTPFKGKGRFTRYQGNKPQRFKNSRFYRGRPNDSTKRPIVLGKNAWKRDPKITNTKCFRCGGSGHIKRDYRVQSHLVKLYQSNITNANTTMANNYLEIEEDLTKYKAPTPPPKIHLVTNDIVTPSISDYNMCILDSGTSHTILKDKRYVQHLFPSSRPITTITGINNLERGHGPAKLTLPNRTLSNITSAIYAPEATRNLLSFHDIRRNGYHIKSSLGNKDDSLRIYRECGQEQIIHKTLPYYPPGLYAAPIYSYQVEKTNTTITELWHYRLGHPGTSMYQIILRDTRGIPNIVHPTSMKKPCVACAQGKLQIRPSVSKTVHKIPVFLEQLNVDVCGPIEPPSGPFCFFLVMIFSSTKWSQVSLMSTRNLVIARLLTQLLRLRAQFPNSPIRTIRIDNAGEFTSPTFDDLCNTLGITIQYSVPYVHTQNGMAESFIKNN